MAATGARRGAVQIADPTLSEGPRRVALGRSGCLEAVNAFIFPARSAAIRTGSPRPREKFGRSPCNVMNVHSVDRSM